MLPAEKKSRIESVLHQVGACLSQAQIDEVRCNLLQHEWLLAVEFIVDFLVENEAEIPHQVKVEILALADAMGGSERIHRGLGS